MKYITRNEFFNALSGLTINEIRDRVLLDTQNSVERYNEIIADYRSYVNTRIWVDHDTPTTESKKEFRDHKAEGLTPETPERISWYAVDFSLGTYGVEFDFITIEPNGIKQVHLKASCSLAEEEPFANYVVGGFMFTEACKLVIAKLLEQPQQSVNIETVETKESKHTHIFKEHAFDVWQSMFDEFKIIESSRADVKFIFEEMKKDRLIHNTVSQTAFLEWITTAHNGLIVQKTSNHSRTKERLSIYGTAKANYLK